MTMSNPRRSRRLATIVAVAAAAALTLAACSSSPGSSTGGSGTTTKSGPIKIALSNYFNGNIWRKQMEASFTETAKANPKYISKSTIVESNGSAPQQAQQIQSLVLQGYDAIVIDAASPTALNGAIQKACDAGVTVVVFDSLATAPCAYKVAFNYVQYGIDEATFAADQLGGKGNVLMVRGIAGNTVDADIYKGVQSVIKKHPDMKIVGEVYGQWTETVAQQEVAKILPSLPKVDAVLTNGNDGGGALQAFQQANVDPLPLVIQGNAGQDLKLWKEVLAKNPSYKTMSVSSQPSISTTALWLAVLLKSGKGNAAKVPDKTIYAPLLEIPEKNLDAWAAKLGYTEIAENPTTLDATQELVDAAIAKKPTYVETPLPPSK
jgi:ribose transport system substrate-binding protein